MPIGYILTDGEYKIVGDDNCQVAEGETGELVVISKDPSENRSLQMCVSGVQ